MHIYVKVDLSYALSFGCAVFGLRCGNNLPNELVQIPGPPFLDNHYCGSIVPWCTPGIFSSLFMCQSVQTGIIAILRCSPCTVYRVYILK